MSCPLCPENTKRNKNVENAGKKMLVQHTLCSFVEVSMNTYNESF